jgi:hypothetical protein
MHLLNADLNKNFLLPKPPHEMEQLKRPNLLGSAREGKIQGKTLAEHHNTQKWTNTKKDAMSKLSWASAFQ